jgi:RNA polymerase sigma factor (TIGR02999 family)
MKVKDSRRRSPSWVGTIRRGFARSPVAPMDDVTRILSAIAQGDRQAASQLLPVVYDELRKLAAHRIANQTPGQTLQPTALVHEAYLRLVGDPEGSDWDNRGHFFAAAAEAMRRILVENARRKGRRKHGGGLARQDLDAAEPVVPEVREDLLALDEALTKLVSVDPQAAQLVQLRYFAGLSIPEASHSLGVSPRTADRLWAFARVWLLREVAGDGSTEPAT